MLEVTFPPTGLPFPVAPWGSSSPPISPSATFILVKSPHLLSAIVLSVSCTSRRIKMKGHTPGPGRIKGSWQSGQLGGHHRGWLERCFGVLDISSCHVRTRKDIRTHHATSISSVFPITELGSGGAKIQLRGISSAVYLMKRWKECRRIFPKSFQISIQECFDDMDRTMEERRMKRGLTNHRSSWRIVTWNRKFGWWKYP